MNDVAKLYQLALNREIAVTTNQVLDVRKIKTKLLAFIDSVSSVGEIAHVYTFWDKEHSINQKDLLEQYMDGMNMLMSIGFELRIDELKPYEEITQPIKADDLMFKIYAGILSLKDTLNPIAYQNVLDDYLHLGFLLKITFDDMMNELK